ncbi:MAG: VWA domain-containing protein, partial [Actinomycetota bacterium]|nr:VWA domain-containing protein [Actinomycetota bacterium]
PDVALSDAALRQVTAVCAAFEVDGLRADLVTARTALALAAWHGRTEVLAEDVRQAALLALPHRRRRNPFDAPGLDEQQLDDTLEQHPLEQHAPEPPQGRDGEGPDDGGPDGTGGGAPSPASPEVSAEARPGDRDPADSPRQPAGEPYRVRTLTVPGAGEGEAGRRSRASTPTGRTTGSGRGGAALHLSATVHAAAPHQLQRGRRGPGLVLRRDDLRTAVREGRESNLVLFVVDASGSMAARQRMGAVKGAVLSLLLDAYQRRDKVGLVTFRGSGAELALPPTSSVEAGARRLEALPTGGRTPLSAGLLRAYEVLRVEQLRDPRRRALVVLVTDGRHTAGPEPALAARLVAGTGAASVIVDCESGPVRLGLAARLAGDLGGESVRLEELAAAPLAGLVRELRRAA